MRKSKFNESQIAAILKEAEAGQSVADVARKHGISAATFYACRSKYDGIAASDMQRRRLRGSLDRSPEAEARLVELAQTHPAWGCPKLHRQLRHEGHRINHKRTERLYRQHGLSIRRRRRRRLVREIQHPLVQPIQPGRCRPRPKGPLLARIAAMEPLCAPPKAKRWPRDWPEKSRSIFSPHQWQQQ